MKQVVQNLRTGELSVVDVPAPMLRGRGVIVRTACSVISAGTERHTVATARRSLVGKALERPDLARRVVDTALRQGLKQTWAIVKDRLDAPTALGYSSAGIVVDSACADVPVGARVACAGQGYASHAEVVYVPRNLAAVVPDGVDLTAAAFTTLGAIALHGVRQAEPAIGERVLVVGLGLIGLLTIQILLAHGCAAYGVDLEPHLVDLARDLGADGAVSRAAFSPLGHVEAWTGGRGFDSVVITAAAKSNDPIALAAEVARDRGRVVIVGAVPADLPREPFYGKELSVRFSRSYGPGRYDTTYEDKGVDYPFGYVRWTEERNMGAFLELLRRGSVRVAPLVSHRFPLDAAREAYDILLGTAGERPAAVVFDYDTAPASTAPTIRVPVRPAATTTGRLGIGFVGAGNFAQHFLLPEVRRLGRFVPIELVGVATATGVRADSIARKHGFGFCTTDAAEVIEHPGVDAVFIVTRHDSHAALAAAALRAKKHVFVEKPLAIDDAGLAEVVAAAAGGTSYLAVGFNRRFAPDLVRLRRFLDEAPAGPLLMSYRVNAGPLTGHWLQDEAVGGGRVVGEGCHFVDAMIFLTGGQQPVRVHAAALGRAAAETVTATLEFADGSVGTLSYVTVGDRAVAKERLEVFGRGRAGVLDDFRSLRLYAGGRQATHERRWTPAKGYGEEVTSFLEVAAGRAAPAFTLAELATSARATFRIRDALAGRRATTVDHEARETDA